MNVLTVTHVFRVDNVLEVSQSDLSVVADGAAEHVFQPFQILRGELTPGTAIKRRGMRNRSIAFNRPIQTPMRREGNYSEEMGENNA